MVGAVWRAFNQPRARIRARDRGGIGDPSVDTAAGHAVPSCGHGGEAEEAGSKGGVEARGPSEGQEREGETPGSQAKDDKHQGEDL